MVREIRFQNTVNFNNFGCIPEAIAKSGLTLEQILKDIKEEKETENSVMNLHQEGLSKETIAKRLNLKLSKVKHIIKFDSLGLSYRKVGKRR
ncbi:MAG: hypothetical protein Tsb0033_27740 [Winogradskyella sp.]